MANLSRMEKILADGETYTGPTLSRVEKLLKEGGSGGGGYVPTEDEDLLPMDVEDVMSTISTDND